MDISHAIQILTTLFHHVLYNSNPIHAFFQKPSLPTSITTKAQSTATQPVHYVQAYPHNQYLHASPTTTYIFDHPRTYGPTRLRQFSPIMKDPSPIPMA